MTRSELIAQLAQRFQQLVQKDAELAVAEILGAVGNALCSGGRVDRDPQANTAIGLPKLLLMAGSRVVIASPWPITPIISGCWLETFMAEWDRGQTALDATFAANAAVDARFGHVPQYAMAMTAYGDVMLTKPPAV